MIEIISGTDRPGSMTLKVARLTADLYREAGASVDLIDLAAMNFADAIGGGYYSGAKGDVQEALERVNRADALVMVIPEYNGSYPGALKLFIDYWKYPETFDARPVAFIGLGGRWGGLRPVEHMQQVIGYRNGYVFPQRLFLTNVKEVLKNDSVGDSLMRDLMKAQTRDFIKFVKALKSEGLDANSRLKAASQP